MGRLWDEFPQPQEFYCTPGTVAVTGDRTAAGTKFGPEGAVQVELFMNTMNWLIDEHFLRAKMGGGGMFSTVSLTQKGFSVLSEVPRAVAGKADSGTQKPLGALIREATVSSTVGVLAGLIQSMLQQSSGSH